MPRWIALAALALGSLAARTAVSPTTERIAPNDNRHTAGTLRNGVLTVVLEARTGVWQPEGENGRALDVAAFAEAGKPLSTPGPFIRVPEGTEIRATIRNRLDKPLIVYGFGHSRGLSDSVIVPVNGAVPLSFTASTPGTWYYMAKRGGDPVFYRPAPDMQLNGVIVVDPKGAVRHTDERVFGMSWWCAVNPASKTGLSRCTMAINGLSWPHTERLAYTQGDSIRWRVVNFTELDHPMHLHGFFFRTDSKGDGVSDSLFTAAQQRMAVTELVPGFATMSLAWQADRPGNWIYHCHYATHISNLVELDTENGMLDSAMLGHHMSDRPHQMFGLVMGISVAPKGPQAVSAEAPRAIRLVVREKPNVYGDQPAMSFALDGTTATTDSAALQVPGPALILERGKPVAVTIVNHTSDHAAVHWHGVELESYPDGVPGWSGSGANILPSIAPHDSLTVRWTPPRAGSYMYHSHFNESVQLGGGLYGPIIVLEPGERFNPDTDRVLFFGTAGRWENPVFGPFPPYTMNGDTQPQPLTLKAGVRYRLRLFNLAGDSPLQVSITSGDKPITWRPVAKDGYPLQAAQQVPRPAVVVFDPGEIYDFEVTPTTTGELTLKFGLVPSPPPPPPPPGTPPPAPAQTAPTPGAPPAPAPPATVSVVVHVQ
ncbi:MAG TPA: multicopper oxidase domain-containing protein [Gemmatimonadales bacterium]|nr:multicopper oxidase domain-containing protein [Gemmatimonadales bacterium]